MTPVTVPASFSALQDPAVNAALQMALVKKAPVSLWLDERIAWEEARLAALKVQSEGWRFVASLWLASWGAPTEGWSRRSLWEDEHDGFLSASKLLALDDKPMRFWASHHHPKGGVVWTGVEGRVCVGGELRLRMTLEDVKVTPKRDLLKELADNVDGWRIEREASDPQLVSEAKVVIPDPGQMIDPGRLVLTATAMADAVKKL